MPSRFRNSHTQSAGHEAARIMQGTVNSVNTVKWTVDVVAQFDRKRYFNIQVGSAYLHHSAGEGSYVVPEVGSTCMVCWPSDSSPPFVLSFVMPSETIDGATTDAPSGTNSHGQKPANATDASFYGGRPSPQPGDICMRTRDGNFVILHRGGVLQIGATPMAQRIYIPLGNLITDISQNYEHHNSNGSVVWGIQEGPSQTQYPSQHIQTFRVFATDQYADIKVATGDVLHPIPEPDGGTALATAGVGQGDDGQGKNPVICEVTVSPKGFVTETGAAAGASTGKSAVFKFIFDRTGNVLMRAAGNLYVQVAKQLTLDVTGAIQCTAGDTITLKAPNGVTVDGGTVTTIKGNTIRLGAAGSPVARVGDMVSVSTVATPCIITFGAMPVPGPNPCILMTESSIPGTILTGNAAVVA